MRIVAHNGARIWGGAERATVALLEGLAGRGHEVLLLCNAHVVEAEASRRGIPARICALGGDVALPHSLRLAGVLRRITPDVFIVGTFKKLFLATLGARLAGVPRVVARVGLETDTPRSGKYRFALRHWTDGVAVNASRMIAPFAGLDGFGQERVALIHNGVRPPNRRNPAGAVRIELGIDADTFVIGTVARLARQKRIDRLLDVVSTLPRDVHCVIAGGGEERLQLKQRATALDLDGRVHFLGDRDDIADVLDSFDVFVVSSDREGISNAMLEGMSLGLPVISTPVSGADDALGAPDNGERAGIIAEFSAESIAEAVLALRDDSSLRQSLGAAAKTRAAAEFSMETMLDRWEEFLSRSVPR
jgi:glycosyltransferase involved in cell wall biosynthesis